MDDTGLGAAIDRIDLAVSRYVNSFSGISSEFDKIVLGVFFLHSVKMLPLVTCLIWLWHSGKPCGRQRSIVLSGLGGGCLALLLSRIIQNSSDHKPRPSMNTDLAFQLPEGGHTLEWSSFPSDTASLAFSVAFAIWLASRRLGLFALLWATFVITFPRLYGGYHYLSDLVAGALIGIACTYAVHRARGLTRHAMEAGSRLPSQYQALLYTAAFIVAFQLSTFFADVRDLGGIAARAVGWG